MTALEKAEAAFQAYYEHDGRGQADEVWKRIATKFGVLGEVPARG